MDLAASTPRPTPAPADRLFKIHAGVTQEYVLGPGDVLSISDLSSDDDKPTSATAPILPDGTAVIRYCGVINAAGMSLREVNELVNERAKKLFVDPEIVVNLAAQRPTTAYVLGDVMKPGLYAPSGSGGGSGSSKSGGDSQVQGESENGSAGASPVQGPFNVSTAIQLAGGLKDTADVRHIHVTRLYPKQVIPVDLWKLMLDGDVTEDLLLQPGDVVFVPKGGTEVDRDAIGSLANNMGTKVRVLGEVRSPGLQIMDRDDDILNVIAKAGGPSENASARWAYLSRTNLDGTVSTEKIDLKKGMKNGNSSARQKVKAGDIIVIKTSVPKVTAHFAGRMGSTFTSQFLNMFLLRNVIMGNGTGGGSGK